MSRERLLVASTAQQQIKLAAQLLRDAAANLVAMRITLMPALESAKRAIREAEVAEQQTAELIKRIP